MSTKKAYTDIYDVYTDLSLYVISKKGGTLDLSLFPALARQRYSWIVANWNLLYPKFKFSAAGDQGLEDALKDFDSSVKSYKLSTSRNPLNSLENKAKFDSYRPFLRLIDIQSVGLNQSELSLVDVELQRISLLSSEDFRAMQTFLKSEMALLSSGIGLYDSHGFKAINAPSIARQKAATLEDLKSIDNIIFLSKYVESIIMEMKQSQDKPPNLLAISNDNMVQTGSNSKIDEAYLSGIPIPFEISLEHMAQKYLGDKSLWYELATVNNLQPPYIDEIGTKFIIVAPGATNNLTISSEKRDYAHVGASIGIGSRKEREELRYIEKISYNNDNTMVFYLSGAQNLYRLKPEDAAYVRIYQPHTTNSGKFVNVPLKFPSPSQSSPTPRSDSLRRLDKALLNFGVDVAQGDDGDLSIGANGNFDMAFGLKNLRQTVKNVIQTVKGELPFHKNYGLNIDIGGRFFGPVDQGAMIATAIVQSVKSDQRITSCEVTAFAMTQTSIAINLLVKIAGLSEAIPLSFIG